MASIPEAWQKIKVLVDAGLKEWGLFVVVILVTLTAFGLGRLSALEEGKPLISLGEAPLGPRQMAAGGLVVASWGGTSYYFPWCAGVAKIKEGNKRYFATEDDARRSGLVPAKNCKGL